jgi:hypothetical protein
MEAKVLTRLGMLSGSVALGHLLRRLEGSWWVARPHRGFWAIYGAHGGLSCATAITPAVIPGGELGPTMSVILQTH